MNSGTLTTQISSKRKELVAHPTFTRINSLPALHDFMETHVWAVWDFMVLLKALQNKLTCTDTLWVPTGNPVTRRLINEIVLGEESDVDAKDRPISHFELYVEAMEQAGANTQPITSFIAMLKSGMAPVEAMDSVEIPAGAKQFVAQTLATVESGELHTIASVFTYGREDLIPDMFIEIVAHLRKQFPDKLNKFVYYLDRHIEVDGDLHGNLAEQMVEELCGSDISLWSSATVAAEAALDARIALWDSVLELAATKLVD